MILWWRRAHKNVYKELERISPLDEVSDRANCCIIMGFGGVINQEHPNRRRALPWPGVALFALVPALGTDIWIQNNPLQAEDPTRLPAAYLGRLPGLGLIRVWALFNHCAPFCFITCRGGSSCAARTFQMESPPWSNPLPGLSSLIYYLAICSAHLCTRGD